MPVDQMTVPVSEDAFFAAGFPSDELNAVLALIRPALQADGGDFVVHGVDGDGVVHLELMGACGTCPLLLLTLVGGIEQLVMAKVPSVTAVVARPSNISAVPTAVV
jgi:Fe-S cluster biogenesis protein NfuA